MATDKVKVPLSVSLPLDMVYKIDDTCRKNESSRSAFIHEACAEKLESKKNKKKESK